MTGKYFVSTHLVAMGLAGHWTADPELPQRVRRNGDRSSAGSPGGPRTSAGYKLSKVADGNCGMVLKINKERA